MEPEVVIIEINGSGVYRVFSTGILFVECTQEEVLKRLAGKLHMFILVSSNIDRHRIHKISSYFFSNSQIESMSVMYSSVSTSLALGLQNTAVVTVNTGAEHSLLLSVDLVQKSRLNYVYSVTKDCSYSEGVETILEHLHSSVYKNSTDSLYVKGDPLLVQKVIEELNKRSLISLSEEEGEDRIEGGYRLAEFPKYFTSYMPHNLLPDSELSYVGAVLTIMINYFEIKEVNTREDFEAGHLKHLLLN